MRSNSAVRRGVAVAGGVPVGPVGHRPGARCQRAQHLRPGPQGGRGGLVGAPAPRHPHPAGGGGRRHLLGEPGLPDAGLAAEQHHRPGPGRRRRQPRDERGQLVAAADEARPGRVARHRVGADRHRRRPRPVHGGVLGEHGPLQALQLGAGVDAQLVAQQLPAARVRRERVGLAAGAVQREHQRPPQPLPQGVHRHQPLQLGHGVLRPARGQHRLDVALQRHRPQLGEPRAVGLHGRAAVPRSA
jgi:hypothetical protein